MSDATSPGKEQVMAPAATWFATVLAVGLMACAPKGTMSPRSAQQMTDVQANIRAAQESGAEQEPRAALHLKLARDQLSEARRLSGAGEYRASDRALARAAHDAELARTVARETNLRRDADATQARIDALPSRRSQEVTP
jgi:hypothetical protein